jgi:hypothetical protein
VIYTGEELTVEFSHNLLVNLLEEGGIQQVATNFWSGTIPGDLDFAGGVNLIDFALFAKHWLNSGCNINNDWCERTDVNHDGDVDFEDLRQITNYWLAGCQP